MDKTLRIIFWPVAAVIAVGWIIYENHRRKTQINLLDFLLGFLVLVFITIVLTSMGWEAAYQSRYKKDVAPIKAELAVSQSEISSLQVKLNTTMTEVNYWQNKYGAAESEIKTCRQVLKDEVRKIKQVEEFLKEHKRARKYFK